MPGSFVSARFHADDNFGKPLVGGRLYTYANGTTIPAETYQDAAGTILNTNPIILDGRGEAVIFLTADQVYTFQLQNANGSVVWTQNDISGSVGSGGGGIGNPLQIYAAAPTTDVGPIYLTTQGPAEFIDGRYQSLYSMGFGGGGYGFKNKMRNSEFTSNSRNQASYAITAPTTGVFTLDNVKAFVGSNAQYTFNQLLIVDPAIGPTLQEGAQGRGYISVNSTAAVSPAAPDKNKFSMAIEGYDAAEFGFGASVITNVSISFRINATIPGVYSMSVSNDIGTRSYVFPVTVNSANTWEVKSVVIPSDTLNPTTWLKGTGAGMVLSVDLGSGVNYETAAPNTWQTGQYLRTSGAVRLCANNGAAIRLTQVQVEKGNQPTPFSSIPTWHEVAWNQRYYAGNIAASARFKAAAAGDVIVSPIYLPITMRAVPSLTLKSAGTQLNVSSRTFTVINNNGARMEITAAAAGDSYVLSAIADFDAEMSYV